MRRQLGAVWLMFRKPKKRWEQDAYDCAVVCGCQVGADGTPSKRLAARVEKAVELWKDKKVKYLIMSGAAVYNAFAEAPAMKRYAVELGVLKNTYWKKSRQSARIIIYCMPAR